MLSLLLAVLMAVALVLPAAAAEKDLVELGQIAVNMPQITVELKGTDHAQSDISATLDGEALRLDSAAAYDPGKDTTRVYILVDLSTSMRSGFDLVKANIVTFIESMGEHDQLVLITFGKTTVDTVLSGGEKREDAIKTVKALKCNERGTLFYEALSRAYQICGASTEQYDREYVLAFSDGIDYQKGNTTFNETLDRYDSRALPLYAACCANTSKAGADQFGQIARASGGGISIIKNKANFKTFLEQINDVTLIRLVAGSNRADGKEKQLTLKIGDLQVEHNIPILRSQPDEQAPTVRDIRYDADKSAIVITFSEKVLGASEAKSYKITDANGTALKVSGVYYSESDNAYELRFDEAVLCGAYTVSFSGITDASQEANPLTGEKALQIENGAVPTQPGTTQDTPKQQGLGPVVLWAGIAAVVLLLLVVIIVVVVMASRKRPEEAEERIVPAAVPNAAPALYEYSQAEPGMVKHHIKADSSVRIQLRIVTGKSSEQIIETNLVSSLIIGRSDACDIYIDDTKLSRQHFVLENDDGVLYIMDLQSRNGTMLNGVRTNSRHVLKSGDRILAGLSEIMITVTGR